MITVTDDDNATSAKLIYAWIKAKLRGKDPGRYCRSCPVAIALQRVTQWPHWEVTDTAANLDGLDSIVTFDLPPFVEDAIAAYDEAVVEEEQHIYSLHAAFALPGLEEAMDWTMYRLAALASGAESVEERPRYHYGLE